MASPTGPALTDLTPLFGAMAQALADDQSADLAALVPGLATDAWTACGADVLLCWALRGRIPPPAVLSAALEATAGLQATPEGEANAWAVRVLVARFRGEREPSPPAHLSPPADLDWYALSDWFARRAAMALPGGPVVINHGPELVRGVALALLAQDHRRTGALLRWLAVGPTSVDRLAADALAAALEGPRPPPDMALPVLMAWSMWRRRDQRSSSVDGVPPRPLPHSRRGSLPLVDSAIDWLERHLNEFNARQASFRKLGELALLGDVLIREGEARGVTRWVDHGWEFLRRVWAELDGGALLRRAIEADPQTSIGVTIYGPLHRRGLRNEELEAAIALHAGAIGRPFAYLAALPMRAMHAPLPWTIDEAFAWTMAGRGTPPWRLSAVERYLLPHIAWYEVDYGLPGETHRAREYLLQWLPVWLLHCEETGSIDLLAEMIVAWHCVADGCCPPGAWDTLRRAQQSDGRVAFGRGGRPLDDYHSTLVAVMAAVSCRHGHGGAT